MNGNGSINMMNVAINNAQDTDRILTEQEIMSAPDCIDSALKHGKRPADYCSDKSFKAFWGMTKEEAYEKNLEDARKILAGQKEEEIGSVFEKPQYPDLKEGLTKVKGIDQNVLDNLKNQVDMLDSSKKEAELKSKDEATMSGPATRSSFGDLK